MRQDVVVICSGDPHFGMKTLELGKTLMNQTRLLVSSMVFLLNDVAVSQASSIERARAQRSSLFFDGWPVPAMDAYDTNDGEHPNKVLMDYMRSQVHTPNQKFIATQQRRKHLQKHHAKKKAK